MGAMFNNADSFDQPIGNWVVTSVTVMEFMFAFNSGFNQDISGWSTAQVTTMQAMFRQATNFDQDLSIWDLSSVNTIQQMFDGATALNQDLCAWNDHVQSGTTVTDAFASSGCTEQGDPDLGATPPGPFCAACS